MAPAPQGPTPRVPWPQPSTIGPKLNFQGSSACPLPPLPPPSPPSPTPWLHGPSGPGPYPHGPMVQPSTIELSFKGSSACQLPPLPPTARPSPMVPRAPVHARFLSPRPLRPLRPLPIMALAPCFMVSAALGKLSFKPGPLPPAIPRPTRPYAPPSTCLPPPHPHTPHPPHPTPPPPTPPPVGVEPDRACFNS